MRILYIDIDALRPDHLGCYGYARSTSPTIDRLAGEGVRLTNCYASDVPCLPSRSSMMRGQFGCRHGAVTHTGSRCQPWPADGSAGFGGLNSLETLPAQLRKCGHRTATISSFPERHHAYHFLAGFNDVIDPGLHGHDDASDVTPLAIDWLDRHGGEADWFLHVNFWDVHNPYRVPADFPDVPEPVVLPAWLTEERIAEHGTRPGIRSALDAMAFRGDLAPYPRQPRTIENTEDARRLFAGYDIAIRYVDHHIGLLLKKLESLGVADDTAIVIAADHGENLGELNSYGGHCTACEWTGHIPAIIRWPGRSAAVHDGLHYHLDLAATLVDRTGGDVPDMWDGVPIDAGPPREALVTGQLAQCCQRGVRFNHNGRPAMALRTWYDGEYAWPAWMAFDLSSPTPDPLPEGAAASAIIAAGRDLMEKWSADCAARSPHPDPLAQALAESGFGEKMADHYRRRLETTGRGG